MYPSHGFDFEAWAEDDVLDRQLMILLVSLSAGIAAGGALAAWQVALAVWVPLSAAWLVWCGFVLKGD